MRSTFKTSQYPLADTALKMWFYQARAVSMTISQELVAIQAKLFYDELYPFVIPGRKIKFTASLGFVQRFRDRYIIKLSANKSAVALFLAELQLLKQDYSLDQIYNADETGLNYKSLPNTSLTMAQEKTASDTKKKMEQISFLSCSNASASHSMPLTFIHKVMNPRCFQTGGKDPITNKMRTLDKKDLPVSYKVQSNAWMTMTIFEEWFHGEFVPQFEKNLISISQEPKAILLLDNCPCHPEIFISRTEKIKRVILPPSTKSLIQLSFF